MWTSIYERVTPKYEVWTKNLPDDDMGTHHLTDKRRVKQVLFKMSIKGGLSMRWRTEKPK